jgi:hypothetical protein
MWPLPKRAVGAAVAGVAAVAFAQAHSAGVAADFELVVSDPHPLPVLELAI